MRKIFLGIGIFVIAGGYLFIIPRFAVAPVINGERVFVPEKETEKNVSSSIKILFTGDLMLDRGVKYYIEKEGDGRYRFPFEKIHDYLSSFDAVIPNLEGPISDKGTKVGSIYSFRMDPKALDVFPYANIRAVNIANNHAWDYGREAFEDTLRRLEESGVGYFGGGMNETDAYAPYILEKEEIRVGILGFTEFLEYARAGNGTSGIAFAETEKIKSAIREAARQNLNALIVVFHFGEEYFLEPIERQIFLARLAINEGADMVVGHHPHVIESSEEYKGKPIFYSLGNFIFDQNFSEETMTPGFLEVEISKQGITSVFLKEGSLTPFYQVVPPK